MISLEGARKRYRSAKSQLKEKLSKACIQYIRANYDKDFLLRVDHIENTTLFPYHDPKQINRWEVFITFSNGAILDVLANRDKIEVMQWDVGPRDAEVEKGLTLKMVHFMAKSTLLE